MPPPPPEIPRFGKGALPPSAHEADSFLDEVDDVTRLVDGLRTGKVSAEYVDRVLAEKDASVARSKEETQKKEAQAEKNKYENLSPDKKAEVKQKVAAMIAEKDRREKARALFQHHRGKMSDAEKRENAKSATDYHGWDLWTPSDDEDDPWMSYMPDNPAFKAMESDIDKRHAKQVGNRQTVFRKRNEGTCVPAFPIPASTFYQVKTDTLLYLSQGNAALKNGQVSEALKIYESGLESDKRSIELHGNASLAALKLGCFAQTIEHCDKVCELADYFLQNPKHGTKIKCLMRRAAARDALGHLNESVADLELALELDPDDKEITAKLQIATRKKDDAEVERSLAKRLGNKDDVASRSCDDSRDYQPVLCLEKLMRHVGVDAATDDDGTVDYAEIEHLLRKNDNCRVFIRGAGGVGIGKLLTRLGTDKLRCAVGDEKSRTAIRIGALKALVAACESSESSCECVTSCKTQTRELVRFLGRPSLFVWNGADGVSTDDLESAEGKKQHSNKLDQAFHATELLRCCSQHAGPRKKIVHAFVEVHSMENGGQGGGQAAFGGLVRHVLVPEKFRDPETHGRVLRNAQTALSVLGNLFTEQAARQLIGKNITASHTHPLPVGTNQRSSDSLPHCIGGWVTRDGCVNGYGAKNALGECARLAAVALGNLCQDPTLLDAAVVGASVSLPARLVRALPVRALQKKETPAPRGLGGTSLQPKPCVSHSKRNETNAKVDAEANTAAACSLLACLGNVFLSPGARKSVDAGTLIETILPWLEEDDGSDSLLASSHDSLLASSRACTRDSLLASTRACTVLARCARDGDTLKRLRAGAGAGGALLVAKFLKKRVADATSKEKSSTEKTSQDDTQLALSLDAAMLLLTHCMCAPGVDVGETESQSNKFLNAIAHEAGTAIALLCAGGVLKSSRQSIGNACLTFGALAKCEELLPYLASLNPIPGLLKTCKVRMAGLSQILTLFADCPE